MLSQEINVGIGGAWETVTKITIALRCENSKNKRKLYQLLFSVFLLVTLSYFYFLKSDYCFFRLLNFFKCSTLVF